MVIKANYLKCGFISVAAIVARDLKLNCQGVKLIAKRSTHFSDMGM